MATFEVKDLDLPDEARPFEGKGHDDAASLGGHTAGRGVLEPGWRWVRPVAGFVAALAFASAAAANAAPPKQLITSSNSGPGAAAVASVPANHGHAVLILKVTTEPSNLLVQVEWTLTCPGRRHGLVTTHTPFSRTIKNAKGCAATLQGQLWVAGGKVANGAIHATILGA